MCKPRWFIVSRDIVYCTWKKYSVYYIRMKSDKINLDKDCFNSDSQMTLSCFEEDPYDMQKLFKLSKNQTNKVKWTIVQQRNLKIQYNTT